jgi:hypothetical protein
MQFGALYRSSVFAVALVGFPQIANAQYLPLGTVNEAKTDPAKVVEARWEVTPQLGMYVPTGLLTTDVGSPNGEFRRQVMTAGLGARVGLRVAKRLGLEATGFYSRSMVALADNSEVVDIPAGVLMASARSVLQIGGTHAGGWNLHMAPGVGVIVRHGAAWEGSSGNVDAAFVLAGGARAPLGKSGMAFRIDLENWMSRAQFVTPESGLTESRIQHDVILSTGFVIPLRSR